MNSNLWKIKLCPCRSLSIKETVFKSASPSCVEVGDHMQESALSFHCVDFGSWIWAMMLSGKYHWDIIPALTLFSSWLFPVHTIKPSSSSSSYSPKIWLAISCILPFNMNLGSVYLSFVIRGNVFNLSLKIHPCVCKPENLKPKSRTTEVVLTV